MRGRTILCAALFCLLLTGCAPHADEPDGLTLVRVLGVDGGGPVTLTAVCDALDEAEPYRGSVSGENFVSARERLPWSGSREMALTSLSYLIINKDADLKEVLTCVLNDRDLSPAALVWLTEDAAALLEGCGDPISRLEVLMEGSAPPPTAAEALAELVSFGEVDLPVLTLKEGEIEWEGTARWTENK